MPIPHRPKLKTSENRWSWVVTDDGSRTLEDRHLGETFHSGCGALSECWFVYLEQSGIRKRLCEQSRSRVLEFGLGTGLAFLLTAGLAEFHKSKLDYFAIESTLLPEDVFADLDLVASLRQSNLKELRLLADECLKLHERFCVQMEKIRMQTRQQQRCWQQITIGDFVSLKLRVGQMEDFPQFLADRQGQSAISPRARTGCQDSTARNLPGFHAIYFDPFSPESNPSVWQLPIYQAAFDVLAPGGHLVSYCVKGSVRRDLRSVGFHTSKNPGPPGGKREVLQATKPGI